ncbi:MAG: PRC-barrel domain-containing protein [Chloroflexota bacterium]
MNNDPNYEEPRAWSAILSDTPLVSSDGESVGAIAEVLGSEEEDIFHGIVITQGNLGHEVFVPADTVTDISNVRVHTKLSSEQVRALAPYVAEDSYKLGITGFLRHKVGWVKDQNRQP